MPGVATGEAGLEEVDWVVGSVAEGSVAARAVGLAAGRVGGCTRLGAPAGGWEVAGGAVVTESYSRRVARSRGQIRG
jgi:hypothetical protein